MSGYQESSDKSWRAARHRKLRARERLSYMLLDVFLGAFVVGIVLMTTLGRPAQTNSAAGAGGEKFMSIEVYWDKADVLLVPVIEFAGRDGQFRRVSNRGMAAFWDGAKANATIWPDYNKQSGEVLWKSKLWKGLLLDGFDARHDSMRMTRDRRVGEQTAPWYFGQVLLSEPCPGKWKVGIRVIETPVTMTIDDVISVGIDVRTGGFSSARDQENISQRAALSEFKDGEVFATMHMSNNDRYLQIELKSEGEEVPSRCLIN